MAQLFIQLQLQRSQQGMQGAKKVGGELQSIKQPEKVKVLILSQNRTTGKDFYLINSFTKLIKIDLSYNKIASFPPGFTFNQFTHLRTLFLHYNKFTVIKNLLPITECQSIQYLTLFGNPLQQAKARHFFINQMPNLMLMDDKIVPLQQRNPDFNMGDNKIFLLPFPLVAISQDAAFNIYIESLIKELTVVRSAFLKANPVIKIQRWWRHSHKVKKTHWNPILTPRQKAVQKQSSLKDYKNDLGRLMTEKMQISKSGDEIVASLIYENHDFWSFMKTLVQESKIYLTREYCKLRAIQFVQIDKLAFIRNLNNIIFKPKERKNLLFFQYFHHQIIIKKQKNTQMRLKDISLKICQIYRINRKKFLTKQQKLMKRQATHHPYVDPLLSKHQLMTIIKKQYKRYIINKGQCVSFVIAKLAQRPTAAVSIQRYWRGYRVRKSFDAYLKIKQKECAIKIQRWVRKLKFIHRHKFLLQVSHYLKREKNNEIVLQMSQIEAIQTYCTYKQTEGVNLIIPFQLCQFTIVKDSQLPNDRIIFHSERKPYPSYINLTFSVANQQNKYKVQRKSDVLSILFMEVKDVIRFVDSKGVRYVKFQYESSEQALNRKFILALKTYRMINHQFIRSKQANNPANHSVLSIVSEVNQQKIISLVYDHSNNMQKGSIEQLSRKLQNSKSQSSINSDMALISNTLCIKIKYFIVKTDVSCTLFIKQPRYQLAYKSQEASRLNLNQFYLAKKSKRYGEESNNGDTYPKISRNIMSLNELEGMASRDSGRKTTQRKETGFNKILNTDQSNIIIGSLSRQNSLKKIQAYRKMQSFDRFDRQVYPPLTEVARQSLLYEKFIAHRQELIQKKEKIEQIKSAHRKNVAYMNNRKTQNISNIRRSIAKESEDNVKKIDEARSILEYQKIKKHDRIKEHFKSPANNFEKEFLKKGINSIKREFKQYEKHRSFRQSSQGSPVGQSQVSHLKSGKILKTQMKQYSISFNEMELGPREQSMDLKNQAHMRQLLKRSIQNYESRGNSHLNSQVNDTIKADQPQVSKVDQYEHRKIKKKRLVHSVFPEEFYPIRQSNQIGFELPKITRK